MNPTPIPRGTLFFIAVPNPAQGDRPSFTIAPVRMESWGLPVAQLAAEMLTLEPRAEMMFCFGPWEMEELTEAVRLRALSCRERLLAGLPLRKEDSIVALPGMLLAVVLNREGQEVAEA